MGATRIRDLLRGVPFLEPLPLPRLERLVRDAETVTVSAGETLFRAGDHGDRFFLIDKGELDVVEFGNRLGRGDSFGEIALLRDVPRTATLRAVTAASLWTITRPVFLAAVTSDRASAGLAEATVQGHLS